MWEFLKNFFVDTDAKVKTPQLIGLVALLLLIFKLVLVTEFMNLQTIFISGLGKFGFIINIFHLCTIPLIILSIICLIAAIFYTIYYIVLSIIFDKKKKISQKFSDMYHTAHRFFIGSKIAIINVDMWLIVMSCYFFIFDESSFIKYKNLIVYYIKYTNQTIHAFLFLYGLLISIAFFKLIESMKYKFLYFRMDEETERKLFEARMKIIE